MLEFSQVPMGVQAADQDLVEQEHFLTASQPSLSRTLSGAPSFPLYTPSFTGAALGTVRNSFLMSNLLDLNTAGLAHKKLENLFPAKLV